MKKNFIYILAVILVGAIATYFLFNSDDKKKKTVKNSQEEDYTVPNDKGFKDFYADAPNPFESQDMENEANRLWASAMKKTFDDRHREKVKEEWRNFAAKYPKNIYIPNDFRQPLTEKEIQERRQYLDNYTAAESNFNRMLGLGKYSEPGKTPSSPKEAGVTPEQQRIFFDYKIREMESRLELMEFVKEHKGLAPDQEATAEKDIKLWKKQLEELKNISKQVPNT